MKRKVLKKKKVVRRKKPLVRKNIVRRRKNSSDVVLTLTKGEFNALDRVFYGKDHFDLIHDILESMSGYHNWPASIALSQEEKAALAADLIYAMTNELPTVDRYFNEVYKKLPKAQVKSLEPILKKVQGEPASKGNPRTRKNALKKKAKRGARGFLVDGDWRAQFKKSYSSRTFKGADKMQLTASELKMFREVDQLKPLVDSSGYLILPKYIPLIEREVKKSKDILAAKNAKWKKENLPTLDQAKAQDADIKGFVSYFKAVREDLSDTEKKSKTSLLSPRGKLYVRERFPGADFILKKVVKDHIDKTTPTTTSTKKAASSFADLFEDLSDDFSVQSESESVPKSKSSSKSKPKSSSKSKSKSKSVSKSRTASQSFDLSTDSSGSVPGSYDFPVSEEEIMESVEKGEVVGMLDEGQILALRATAGNFKDSLDTVQEALDESKELYDNLKNQLSFMGLDVLPNPHGGRRVGSDRYFPGNYSPRILSQLNPRGMSTKKHPSVATQVKFFKSPRGRVIWKGSAADGLGGAKADYELMAAGKSAGGARSQYKGWTNKDFRSVLSQLKNMKVPLSMKATPRRAAEDLYVYPKTKSFPIGDLYHARLAIIYVLSPSNSRQRKRVIKAVQKHWPEYKWSDFWKAKSKGKGLKTWNQYLK